MTDIVTVKIEEKKDNSLIQLVEIPYYIIP